MKSLNPLLQRKVALDALLEMYADPARATETGDWHADPDYNDPFVYKGTEPENEKHGSTPTAAKVKLWDLVQAAGGPLRIKNQCKTPEEVVALLSDIQEKYLVKVRANFPNAIPVNPTEIINWARNQYAKKTASMCTCGHPFEIHTHPPDFGCPYEKECGCKGATEVKESSEKPDKEAEAPLPTQKTDPVDPELNPEGKIFKRSKPKKYYTEIKLNELISAAGGKAFLLQNFKYADDVYDYLLEVQDEMVKELLEEYEEIGHVGGTKIMDWCDGFFPMKPLALQKSSSAFPIAVLQRFPNLGGEIPRSTFHPDEGQYAAVRTSDGQIFADPNWQHDTHVNFINRIGIPPNQVEDGGWLIDGVYEPTDRSDAGKYGMRARMVMKTLDYREKELLQPQFASAEVPITTRLSGEPQGIIARAAYRKAKKAHEEHGNVPDPGKYDEEAEDHVRNEAGEWAQYAEDGIAYDSLGNYLCGSCDMRMGTDECMRVEGPISFEKGSCRLFHLGEPENKPPMKKKFTKEEAKYAETNQGGFGCHRCEYGSKAKQPDSQGRESWCSFWGMHIVPTACCAEQEGEEKEKTAGLSKLQLERAAFIAGLQKFGVNKKGKRFSAPSHFNLKTKPNKDIFAPWQSEAARLGVDLTQLTIPVVPDSGLIWDPVAETEQGFVNLKLSSVVKQNMEDVGEDLAGAFETSDWYQQFGSVTDWTMYQFDPVSKQVITSSSIWDGNHPVVYVYGAGWGLYSVTVDIDKKGAQKIESRYSKRANLDLNPENKIFKESEPLRRRPDYGENLKQADSGTAALEKSALSHPLAKLLVKNGFSYKSTNIQFGEEHKFVRGNDEIVLSYNDTNKPEWRHANSETNQWGNDTLYPLKDYLKKISSVNSFEKTAAGKLYHVTHTSKVPQIKKKGLLPLQPSNWIQGEGGDRYGQGEIFAFVSPKDAVRWGAKMDWSFNQGIGTGKISIVTLDTGNEKWEVDENDPMGQASSEGPWMKHFGRVPSEQVLAVTPLTTDLSKALVKDEPIKLGAVEQKDTPTLLPQRDDMRGHLDEDVKKEIKDIIGKEPLEGVKIGAPKEYYLWKINPKSYKQYIDEGSARISLIPLSKIDLSAKDYQDLMQADLARTYKQKMEKGQRFPLIVVTTKDWKSYHLEDGQNRLAAWHALGHQNVPAIVLDLQKREGFNIAAADNDQDSQVEEIQEKEDKAYTAFLTDKFMLQEALDNGWTMQQLWQEVGTQYANEYWNTRSEETEELSTAPNCPNCKSSSTLRVTDGETKTASAPDLVECVKCGTFFTA
jgi:hypothetical protein